MTFPSKQQHADLSALLTQSGLSVGDFVRREGSGDWAGIAHMVPAILHKPTGHYFTFGEVTYTEATAHALSKASREGGGAFSVEFAPNHEMAVGTFKLINWNGLLGAFEQWLTYLAVAYPQGVVRKTQPESPTQLGVMKTSDEQGQRDSGRTPIDPMGFLRRKWSDAEKWTMGLVSAALLAGAAALVNSLGGDVVAEVASRRDNYGRCVDAEVRLRNDTNSDALEVEIAFDVDHFTRLGTVALEYGDERDQMIPPGQKTLIARLPYTPIPITMDQESSIVRVARLQPGQAVHLFFGGELILEPDRARAREGLLFAKDAQVMDKPRVRTVTRKDGRVDLRRTIPCNSQ